VFQNLAEEEKHHLSTLEQRYKRLLEQDPQLESRPTFLFFKGAANGLFSRGADELRQNGVNDLEAYRIGIRCERGSHRFFKRYGERFEDSEGKQIFLEFAEEERDHLELLIREYRALTRRQRKNKTKPTRRAATRHSASRPSTGSGRP
jgi:rubrerythrin